VSLTVVCGVLFSGDKRFRVEEGPVGPGPHFIDDIGLEVDI
jgi:hypothetical protein